MPQAVEQGATDEGDDGDVGKIARVGGEDVAEKVVDKVGADVFHGRKQHHAEGEGDVRQAAEDVAGVFPSVFFDEVEQGNEQQGDAPDADDWRQAAFQGQRNAEQGGVRQGFAEVNEAAPGDKCADGSRDDAGDEGAEPGDEDEVQDHGSEVAVVVVVGIDANSFGVAGIVAQKVQELGIADDAFRAAVAADVAVQAEDVVARRHDEVQVVADHEDGGVVRALPVTDGLVVVTEGDGVDARCRFVQHDEVGVAQHGAGEQ